MPAAFDLRGAVLLAAAVSYVVLVASLGGTGYAWPSPQVAGLAATGALAFGLLIAAQRSAAEPLLPLMIGVLGGSGLTGQLVTRTGRYKPSRLQAAP